MLHNPWTAETNSRLVQDSFEKLFQIKSCVFAALQLDFKKWIKKIRKDLITQTTPSYFSMIYPLA